MNGSIFLIKVEPFFFTKKTEPIELDELYEQPVLEKILTEPHDVVQVPYDLYNKFIVFLLQEERYEDLIILKKIEEKVVPKTLKDLLDEEPDDEDWSTWGL